MDISEMCELPATELRTEIEKLREKIWKLRFQAKGEPIENPGVLRESKRDVARMLGVLRENELAADPSLRRQRSGGRRRRLESARRRRSQRREPPGRQGGRQGSGSRRVTETSVTSESGDSDSGD